MSGEAEPKQPLELAWCFDCRERAVGRFFPMFNPVSGEEGEIFLCDHCHGENCYKVGMRIREIVCRAMAIVGDEAKQEHPDREEGNHWTKQFRRDPHRGESGPEPGKPCRDCGEMCPFEAAACACGEVFLPRCPRCGCGHIKMRSQPVGAESCVCWNECTECGWDAGRAAHDDDEYADKLWREACEREALRDQAPGMHARIAELEAENKELVYRCVDFGALPGCKYCGEPIPDGDCCDTCVEPEQEAEADE